MGTRALGRGPWLVPDDDQVAAAAELVRARRDDVVAGSFPEAAGALETVVGTERAVDDLDPLVRARLRVAEDLCLLRPGADGWVLAAACVCFPSYWRLSEKIGRPLTAIHEPVPGYAGAVAARVDAFLTRLRHEQIAWRRNWSVHPTDELFVPEHAHGDVPAPPERWLRSERQTLRRLPGVDAVVFTIRTEQVRLDALTTRRTELADALEGWSDEQRAYKGGAVDDALVRWLRSDQQG
jgi:hypothetical protein